MTDIIDKIYASEEYEQAVDRVTYLVGLTQIALDKSAILVQISLHTLEILFSTNWLI